MRATPIAMRTAILLCLPCLAGLAAGCVGGEKRVEHAKPRSVILMIGDGMGFPQIAVSRILALEPGERFRFERLPVTALVTTYSASNPTTDSASSGTAMAAGVKTNNQLIGLDPDGKPVRTITEEARDRGWRVGYVTTTRLTHATPATFYSRVLNRYSGEGEIAVQLVDHEPDVAFGGGRAVFLPPEKGGWRPDGRDLLVEAAEGGMSVWTEAADLDQPAEGPVLGLFADDHFDYRIDNERRPPEERQPTLERMARAALDALTRDETPFFLLIEGGRIDQAAHSSDPRSISLETAAFDDAIAAVLEYRESHPETLVLVTADHATGGLAINDYADWTALGEQQTSFAWLAKQIREEGAGAELVAEMTAWDDLTEEEVAAVREEEEAFLSERILGQQLSERFGVTFLPKMTPDTWGHTGEDVPLYAVGPGAEAFQGVLDNTDLPKILCELLGWPPLNPRPLPNPAAAP